jgi:rabenosyn-5
VIPVSTRRQRCSTFITYEYDNRTITANSGEKGKAIGTVIEIETIEPDLSMNGVMMEKNAPPKIKDERKKVRVCRECLNVVL